MSFLSSRARQTVDDCIRKNGPALLQVAKALEEWAGAKWKSKNASHLLTALNQGPIAGLEYEDLRGLLRRNKDAVHKFLREYKQDRAGTLHYYSFDQEVQPAPQEQGGPSEASLVELELTLDGLGFQSPRRGRARFHHPAAPEHVPAEVAAPAVAALEITLNQQQEQENIPPAKSENVQPAPAEVDDDAEMKAFLAEFRAKVPEGTDLGAGYVLGSFIANGSNSAIFNAINPKATIDGILCVPLGKENRKSTMKTLKLLNKMNNVGQVARLLHKSSIAVVDDTIGLIIEKVRNGTLTEYIQECAPNGISASIATCILYDLAVGMKAFAMQNLGHGDAHPSNIMLDVDDTALLNLSTLLNLVRNQKPIVKLVDLGSTVKFGSDRVTVCTFVLEGENDHKVTLAGEVYTFGALGTFIITGDMSCRSLEKLDLDSSFCMLAPLLSACLGPPKQRPDFQEIVSDLWKHLNMYAHGLGMEPLD